MKRKRTIVGALIALVATLFIWHPAQSDYFINFKPLLKDSVPTNPGLETITPLINTLDTNMDGYPEKVDLAYNVRAAGTNAKLFQTVKRRVDVPPIPCTDPLTGLTRLDIEQKYTREGGDRTNMLVAFEVGCFDNSTNRSTMAYRTVVYSADVSMSPAAGGDSWVKSFDREAMSFDMLDWDNDTEKEIILTLFVDHDTSTDLRVLMFNKDNGTKEADNKYRIGNEL